MANATVREIRIRPRTENDDEEWKEAIIIFCRSGIYKKYSLSVFLHCFSFLICDSGGKNEIFFPFLFFFWLLRLHASLFMASWWLYIFRKSISNVWFEIHNLSEFCFSLLYILSNLQCLPPNLFFNSFFIWVEFALDNTSKNCMI